ncbi:Major facilitator superfamily MFS_1 [metagenome]|uniref:Major facilitator superfamily MFS_1 n=1 Tax=metagenome TaxID=256318 RepID=A0A2P2BYC9_9ZZZZ
MSVGAGGTPAPMDRQAQVLLGLAAVAVAFAAADTYVVVLALPEMMTSAGIPLDQLQRAAPIVSGFLLGYVAMLPLIGRIADLRGRVPVLVMALVLFAVGSAVTALAYDLPSMVAGRFLQGVGGGGLVPATLALVADLYPAERRGVPLGIVSAVQEIGSVIGPLFGAVILAVADWRVIFAINLAVGLVLAASIRGLAGATPLRRRPDLVGLLLLLVAGAATALTMLQPDDLKQDLTLGSMFVPYAGDGRWITPVGLVAVVTWLLLLARCLLAARPLVDLRRWWGSLQEADLLGAGLLAVSLSGVILAFATADPRIEVFSDRGLGYLAGSAIAAVAFALHLRRSAAPLVPRGALAQQPAWGSLLVSFFIGAALIAALIDIPIFARTTIYPDSQLSAALVLLRFLVALPVGAVVGGYLTRSLPAGAITAAGMLFAAIGFVLMSRWGLTSLEAPSASVALVLGGFGFGLALAPVNAAALSTTASSVHGLTTAFVVVARMVGMLVGISALTTIGLSRYYSEQAGLPNVRDVCEGTSRCTEFTTMLKVAGIAQEQTVFLGAACCAVAAGILALVLFRDAPTRGLDTRELWRAGG